jgi:type IV pilus assembly protein PilW
MTRPTVNTPRNPRRREAGFTIVELMVGMLIGLISIVVMFQIFAISEGQRRTTAGAGDAQQNGVTSLYLMERDARLAGYGLNFFRLLGCKVNAFWSPSSTPIEFTMAPAVIVNGNAGTAPDRLTLAYAATDSYSFPSVMAPPSTDLTPGYITLMDERFQFKTGDLFVLGEIPAPAPASQVMKPCSLFQVTSLPGTEGDSKILRFDSNFFVNEAGTTLPANYTPPTAAASTQPPPNNVYYSKWDTITHTGSRVFNLGAAPTVMEYSIVNNQLVARDVLRPDVAAVPISDGIVQFQAQYGFANACQMQPTTIVPCSINPTAANVPTINLGSANDQWGDALPAAPTVINPADWRRIIAVRFVIVSRSVQREKTNPVTGQCDATPNMPVWSVNNQTIDLSADPDWKCYRYRTFEAVVPIRNLMWFPDPNGQGQRPA